MYYSFVLKNNLSERSSENGYYKLKSTFFSVFYFILILPLSLLLHGKATETVCFTIRVDNF